MAKKVNPSPLIPRPGHAAIAEQLLLYDREFANAMDRELREHAFRLNNAVETDGSEVMTNPLVLAEYLKAALPTAADWRSGLITVSDEAGGYTVAFSDGTNWRRVQDRAVVS